MTTRVLIVQPPFVQLNAPYPAPYYLTSFLASRGVVSRVADHSIELFHRIFSRAGLERIFDDARGPILARLSSPRPRGGGGNDEEAIRYNLSRFLSQERLWTSSIDRIVDFLRGEDREFGHLLAAANGALSEGPRLERFLESVEGNPGVEDAATIATLMIADLADFVQVALDPTFSLVRYAESLAASVRSFAAVEPAVDGYALSTFYGPLLESEWDRIEAEWLRGSDGLTANAGAADDGAPDAPFILACTIPFPGCLAGALAAARSAKARFGDRVRTIAGGGYVNTELRSIRSARFFDYFDYLSFDRGYGSLEAILEAEGALGADTVDRRDRTTGAALYKTIYLDRKTGELVGSPDSPARQVAVQGEAAVSGEGGERNADRHARTDVEAIVSTFPDYRSVDFSRYIRPVDDANPMHRLWSDGRWLKAYLAHGCYWHACAFCDVKLDYIRGYASVDVDALFSHLVDQARATGVRGVHLVDEAAPVASLIRLAELNRGAGLPLVFWGNIRFEKEFTPDTAAVLATGGLLGVSAGIEVASERGFKRLGKGLRLADVVGTCAAFKEAGILTHAYLIYGFWDEDEGELIDSAETMRQLFAAGLVDSAFWHKFVLTRHSRIYAEWEKGRHPALVPIEREGEVGAADFADNDLRYEGENRSDRYTASLDALLASWMSGEEIDGDIRSSFPFKVPFPTVASGAIAMLLDDYARTRDAARAAPPIFESDAVGTTTHRPHTIFLGSAPVRETRKEGGALRLRWRWRFEPRTLDLDTPAAADEVESALAAAAAPGGIEAMHFSSRLSHDLGADRALAVWTELRQGGLVLVG